MPIPERPQALQRQSAKSVVYQTVCDWIITGVMKPGEKILDSELASYFNVSRTPVREALQLLQNQKLVCVIPGRTTVVADLDVEDFEKCYRPLAEIDALAAELACRNLTDAMLEELEQEPQMVVSILPPNFLAKYLAAYKRRHPDVRLVFDIFDLWPETFPSSKMKRLLALPFSVWSGLRDHHLAEADRVLTECHMFQERLNLSDEQAHTVFLAAQRPEGLEDVQELNAERIELCYLGAINNIVNIPAIAALAGELSQLRPVTVHIIGEGERREELVQAIRDAGAQAEFHGAIYDEAEKHRILTRCRFGLNLMRDSVCIGLTMKSVDYWKHDLPVINNIPADSARLVEAERIGLNLAPDTAKRIAAMPAEECLAMRKNVRRVFDRCFDLPAVLHEYDAALREIV